MARLITRQEAARILDVSTQTVSNWIEKGYIKAHMLDNHLMIDRETIEQHFDSLQDLAHLEKAVAEKKEHVDVLFMDPPRKGSDERFLNALLKLKPSRVVYVSCDPSTLARDVAYISQSYKIESIQPMDMFPQSFHVETVVSLCLRKK